MYGIDDFLQLLQLLTALRQDITLTDAEKADAVAFARELFLGRNHDPRLIAIVTRITEPAPAPEPAPDPEPEPAPKARRGKGS